MSERVSRAWMRWGAWLLAISFTAVFFALSVLKHVSFHTDALDLAKFDQAIWNSLHGRFLFSTIEAQSILGNHFSPFMAVLAPLFWIWNDVRVLFFAGAIGLAVAGLFLYKIAETKHPQLAPWFLLAFYLNPALHEVALIEFRRVTLAVPFLALALYALYTHRRKWMVVGLLLALLCKENIGLPVFMIGVYLILLERDWKWGIPIALLGLTWAVVVTLWVVPAFARQLEGSGPLYPQLGALCLEGDSYGEIFASILHEPQLLIGRMFDKEGLLALWRIFFPVGLILPFLAFDWLLLLVPSVAYMLMSCMQSIHRLENWYMASVLPGLFAATAVALTRLSPRNARWATAWLLCTTVVGYAVFGHAPLGARYEPALYQLNDHHRLSAQVVDAIPADARVAAQDPYVPHLSHREHIYLFPWISKGLKKIDYFLLDRQLHPYPLQPDEMNDIIDDMVANTSLVVEIEGDGIYLLHQRGEPLPALPVHAVAGETMQLDRVEVAVLEEDGFFHTLTQEPIDMQQGQTVRVSLYWEALDSFNAERTVSVRIADMTGAQVAQSDSEPGGGKESTSGWQVGWEIRDVHYLTVPPHCQVGAATLEAVVYDSLSLKIVPFDDGVEILHLGDVVLVP